MVLVFYDQNFLVWEKNCIFFLGFWCEVFFFFFVGKEEIVWRREKIGQTKYNGFLTLELDALFSLEKRKTRCSVLGFFLSFC